MGGVVSISVSSVWTSEQQCGLPTQWYSAADGLISISFWVGGLFCVSGERGTGLRLGTLASAGGLGQGNGFLSLACAF